MRVVNTKWGNTISAAYFLNRGESIPRHQHVVAHTTACLHGKTEVEVWDGRPRQVMIATTQTIDLPANIDHRITAIEDDTIVLNVIENINGYDPHLELIVEQAKDGGVLLVDGTII